MGPLEAFSVVFMALLRRENYTLSVFKTDFAFSSHVFHKEDYKFTFKIMRERMH